jgi:uroporphyrinogen-III decarboxylase
MKAKLTSEQRIAAAINHKPVDRIPVMCQLALGHYFLNTNYSPQDIWFDSEIFAKALVEVQRRYRFDGILVNLPGRPEYWRKYVEKQYDTGDFHVIKWENGLETYFTDDDNPHTFSAGKNKIIAPDFMTVSPDDLDLLLDAGYNWRIYHTPYFHELYDVNQLFDHSKYPDYYLNTYRKTRELASDVAVHCEVFSSFSHFMEMFGYQEALMALLVDPDKCHAFLNLFTRIVIEQAILYTKAGADAILVSSPLAGAGFISREMYKEFVMPYENQIYQKVHENGCKVYLHTCGDIGDRLDLMAQTELDGIDTLDPPPLGTVNLKDAIEKFGGRFFFKGNLDPVNELLNGTDEQFEQAVLERIRLGKQINGYILSTACSIAPHADPERLKKLVEMVERYY